MQMLNVFSSEHDSEQYIVCLVVNNIFSSENCISHKRGELYLVIA